MNYESVQTGKALCESQCMNFGGDVSLVANLHRCFLKRSVPSPHLLMHCQCLFGPADLGQAGIEAFCALSLPPASPLLN